MFSETTNPSIKLITYLYIGRNAEVIIIGSVIIYIAALISNMKVTSDDEPYVFGSPALDANAPTIDQFQAPTQLHWLQR